jgi:hypothetical protein
MDTHVKPGIRFERVSAGLRASIATTIKGPESFARFPNPARYRFPFCIVIKAGLHAELPRWGHFHCIHAGSWKVCRAPPEAMSKRGV